MELATAQWSHRIVDGDASTTIRLHNGTTVNTCSVGAVLNRANTLRSVGFARSDEHDRAYADAELHALFMSFLRGFTCRVINGVDGQHARGSWSPLRWASLAHRCGIATRTESIAIGTRLPRLREPTTEASSGPWPTADVAVVGESAFGASSREHARQCCALAQLADCEVLGLKFGIGRHTELLSVDPFAEPHGDAARAVGELLCDRALLASELVSS